MHGYWLKFECELCDGDVVHVDMDGPCSDEELEALTEYFKLVHKRMAHGL